MGTQGLRPCFFPQWLTFREGCRSRYAARAQGFRPCLLPLWLTFREGCRSRYAARVMVLLEHCVFLVLSWLIGR